ncbi:hypothetical protein ACMZOO_07960 [Catenovulum sp. SX2]|uniref:hypothetical protein n=1 Tax=Catenovulum sp. SX2 TaxID=3398614 RepID=UPI003F8448C2
MHSFGDFSGTFSVEVVKADGTNSDQLGSGSADSVLGSISLYDVERVAGENVGTISRLKGADFSLTLEQGYTFNDYGQPEFKFEGYSVDAT